ncbi:hypothetical protein SBF1_2050003 [Candidatus Desulfosporosinus infrequens]|uniref:Uncharacterized protein n=1 Tax=Candidatus Desulfosporosinus infrequens TaxID=2043169 RepID=A0A2U3KHY7_9FIRM|nr:hypothetical protein SBF1_2050003 [Candidatus Desulfosporosinus infrequens]
MERLRNHKRKNKYDIFEVIKKDQGSKMTTGGPSFFRESIFRKGIEGF